MKKENSFVKAGVVLVVSGFVVKILGAVYRIPLTRMLGASLMGRYSAVFSIFMPFFAFATAGIVPCVSHFSAKNIHSSVRLGGVVKTARGLYILQAFAVAVAFVAFGYAYSSLRQDDIYFSGAVILAPAIIFAVMENICKGVTQGGMDMLPTAKANVMESVSKAALGLSGVYFAPRFLHGSAGEWQVKAALGAVTVSGFICCVYLLFSTKGGFAVEKHKAEQNSGTKHSKCTGERGKIQQKNTQAPKSTARQNSAAIQKDAAKQKCQTKGKSIKTPEGGTVTADGRITAAVMMGMSFPVAVSALTVSVTGFFDTAVCIPIISRLPYSEIVHSYSGASFKNAGDISIYLLGVYQGMVISVFNLLPAVLSSVGSASLPVVSRAVAKGDKEYLGYQTERIYRITASLCVPASVYLFVFRSDILGLLFGTNSQQTVVASNLLGILMAGSVFCCFTPVFNSVLYAAGKSRRVFGILLCASAVRCALNYALCAVAQINIRSFAVSSVVFHTIIFILSVTATAKLGIKFPFSKVFLMPCAAAAVSLGAVMLLWNMALCWLPLILRLVFSGAIYCLVYLLIAFVTGFILISPPENSNI